MKITDFNRGRGRGSAVASGSTGAEITNGGAGQTILSGATDQLVLPATSPTDDGGWVSGNDLVVPASAGGGHAILITAHATVGVVQFDDMAGVLFLKINGSTWSYVTGAFPTIFAMPSLAGIGGASLTTRLTLPAGTTINAWIDNQGDDMTVGTASLAAMFV